MKSEIINRIVSLRNFMRKHKLSAFIIPSTDPHSGEYIPKHWEARKWISGFTGSAGTVVVTLDKAGLWTDSRYFLQAAEQLENTGITLFKERLPETPSIVEWLGCVLNAEDNVGIDGWVNSYQETSNLQKELEKKQIHLTLAPDPFNELWTDRPALPDNKVFIHELKYAGLSYKDKITQIREAIRRNSCTGILISALDEVAWTLNLRGSDVHCNPVFVSYLLITEYSSTLYIIENKLSDEVKDYLTENEIKVRPYSTIEKDLKDFTGKMVLFKKSSILSKPVMQCVNYIYSHIKERITISTLADYTGLSENYLSRIFKQNLGVSISDYIREKKIEKATHLLRYSDKSLIDIANYLSFSSQSHFIKTFENFMGITPKKYRDKYYKSMW